jgi:hypothetical protein
LQNSSLKKDYAQNPEPFQSQNGSKRFRASVFVLFLCASCYRIFILQQPLIDKEDDMDRCFLTGEDRKLIRNEVFCSVEWTMLDRGVINEEIAEQRILPHLPEHLHDAARGLIEKWDDPIVPDSPLMQEHPSWNRQSSVQSVLWTLSRNEETG